MRNTFIAISVVVLIVGFIIGFTIARGRYHPLLQANSATIISKDKTIKTLQQENTTLVTKKQPIMYEMKNGGVIINDNGKMTSVTKDITTSTGAKISKDGTITAKNGAKIKLIEGQFFGEK